MTSTRDSDDRSASGRCQRRAWWELYQNIPRTSKDPNDPFKREWTSGRRPWQYKDRPKYVMEGELQGKSIDMIFIDDVMDKHFRVDPVKLAQEVSLAERRKREAKLVNCDFTKIEQRILNHYQDAFYGTSLWHAQQRGLRTVESRTRYLNSLRQVP